MHFTFHGDILSFLVDKKGAASAACGDKIKRRAKGVTQMFIKKFLTNVYSKKDKGVLYDRFFKNKSL